MNPRVKNPDSFWRAMMPERYWETFLSNIRKTTGKKLVLEENLSSEAYR